MGTGTGPGLQRASSTFHSDSELKWHRGKSRHVLALVFSSIRLFWFRLPPATKAPRGRPSPCWHAEENEKKQAETGGSG